MSIIPELPEFVISILNTHLIYTQLLKRAEDELLVKLQPVLDLTAIEEACADYHHTSGPGAPPTHSVPRLVRALLVRYLFDWSYRQLEFQLRFNLLVKGFVGYPVFAAGPDHTTLERFEVWVVEHQHRLYFDEVLHQIDADFPEERGKPQIGDTFAMQANAAKESLIRLIRHTRQCLLRALAAVDADAHARVTAQLDHAALFGPDDEPGEYRLDQAGRQQRLQTTVRAALRCARLVQAQLDTTPGLSAAARDSVTPWLQHLDKILADVGVPPKDLAAYVEAQAAILQRGPVLLDVAAGFVYATATPATAEAARAWVEALRQPALAMGGYAGVQQMPPNSRACSTVGVIGRRHWTGCAPSKHAGTRRGF